MKCPYCGSDNHTVNGNHKREIRTGRVRRRRKCLDCGEKFWTIEFYVPDEIMKKRSLEKRRENRKEREDDSRG